MIAHRNLLRRKMRSLLTVTGVAIGVASVVALVSSARGFRVQVNDFFTAGDAHLVASFRGAADPFISFLPDSLVPELEALDEVVSVHPVLLGVKQLGGLRILFFFGTTEGSPFLEQLRVTEGRDVFRGEPDGRELCLGRVLAKSMDLEVGSVLDVAGEEFAVVGLFEASSPFLESGGLMTFPRAQDVAGYGGRMTSALLRLADPDPTALAAAELAIETAFPDVEATVPTQFAGAFDEFELAEQAADLFSLLAVIVGGIGVMNTMLMSVFEKTREIGILRAIGWSRSMVVREVLLEAFLLALVGGPLGIALGVGGLELLGTVAEFGWVQGNYDPRLFAQAMLVAIGMALVGAIYPTIRATRITPMEALRHE